MLQNKILLVRRKISSSCKFFNRLPRKMYSLLGVRKDSRSRLNWALICAMLLIATAFMALHSKVEKTPVRTMPNMSYVYAHAEWVRTYLIWKKKFLAMLAVNEIRAAEAYKNMVKNSLNSQKILLIIQEESIGESGFEDSKCAVIKPDCPRYPPNLQGRLKVKEWLVLQRKKKMREQSNYTYPHHPGIWSPPHCTARHSVAIIIPYRNREHQLLLLLQHLPPILQRQEISYNIFVVEQVGDKTFNKGILMNAGFMIALSKPVNGVPYHCIIFHDADLLAEDDRNMYTCPEFPRHMSSSVDELDYDLPYHELVGGVFSIRTDHFIKLNGYSNLYWGWGGEDDDMGLRVEKAFSTIRRPPEELGRFTTIPHIKQTPFLSVRMRQKLKSTTKERYRTDGLSTVKFTMKKAVQKQQYTHVFIDVGDPPNDYRPMISPGKAELKRTLMQQLIEGLEKLRSKASNITRELPVYQLPGEVPDAFFKPMH